MKALLVAVNAKYIHSNLGIYSIRAYGLAHRIPASSLEVPIWLGTSRPEVSYQARVVEVSDSFYEMHDLFPSGKNSFDHTALSIF